jgi:hypothetical protein
VDSVTSEPGARPFEEPDRGRSAFVVEDFDIREPGAVINRDVDELPAGPVVPAPDPGAGHPVTGTRESAEFLDVDVDQLAGMTTAIPVRWRHRLETRQSMQTETA